MGKMQLDESDVSYLILEQKLAFRLDYRKHSLNQEWTKIKISLMLRDIKKNPPVFCMNVTIANVRLNTPIESLKVKTFLYWINQKQTQFTI